MLSSQHWPLSFFTVASCMAGEAQMIHPSTTREGGEHGQLGWDSVHSGCGCVCVVVCVFSLLSVCKLNFPRKRVAPTQVDTEASTTALPAEELWLLPPLA